MKLTAIATAFLLASLPARAEWVEITLPTGENVKAVYEKPKMVGKVHAVIYLHGRMLREAGYGDAADRGYDIAAFAGAFAHAGFVSIAPLRKTPLGSDNGDDVIDEGLASILGATKFLHQHHDILRISIVGFGEGGLIALSALSQMPDLAKGIVLSPSRLCRDGIRAETRNLNTFLNQKAALSIRAPVLLTVGDLESRRSKRTANQVFEALMKAHRQFRFIRNYPGRQRWFHQPRNAFMDDVIAYLKRYNPGGF